MWNNEFFMVCDLLGNMHQEEESVCGFPNPDSLSLHWCLWKGRKMSLLDLQDDTERLTPLETEVSKMCRLRPHLWCDLMASSNRAASLHGWLKTMGVRWQEPQSPYCHLTDFSSNSRKPFWEALYVNLVPLPESILIFFIFATGLKV